MSARGAPAPFNPISPSVDAVTGVASWDVPIDAEHPVSACYDDAWATLLWATAASAADPWGYDRGDAARVFVLGFSAGGNVVHNLALQERHREAGGRAVRQPRRGLRHHELQAGVVMPLPVGRPHQRPREDCDVDALGQHSVWRASGGLGRRRCWSRRQLWECAASTAMDGGARPLRGGCAGGRGTAVGGRRCSRHAEASAGRRMAGRAASARRLCPGTAASARRLCRSGQRPAGGRSCSIAEPERRAAHNAG